jgi:hypothetical protein
VSVVSDQAADQARFAAREFVDRWYRETGVTPSAVVTDRMLFAYEMGYLRGHSVSMQTASTMFDELLSQARSACQEGKDDDADSESD